MLKVRPRSVRLEPEANVSFNLELVDWVGRLEQRKPNFQTGHQSWTPLFTYLKVERHKPLPAKATCATDRCRTDPRWRLEQ